MIEERKKLKQLNDSISMKKMKMLSTEEVRKRPPLDEVRVINSLSPKFEK